MNVRRDMFDPPLTNHGHRQSGYLARTFPYMDKITHVLVSPSQRTLQTLLIGFEEVFNRGLTGIVLGELRETTSFLPCNSGPPRGELMLEHMNQPLCFRILKENWTEDSNWKARGAEVRRFLGGLVDDVLAGRNWRGLEVDAADGKDVHVLVVSHQHILCDVVGLTKEGDSKLFASLSGIWLTYRPSVGKRSVPKLRSDGGD
jgi:broad specificity phosphatase PhoE